MNKNIPVSKRNLIHWEGGAVWLVEQCVYVLRPIFWLTENSEGRRMKNKGKTTRISHIHISELEIYSYK